MEWLEGNRIQVVPPKFPKKLTATRFASVLGLNPWSTPFEVWCAVTRTYEKPFEDTIYTKAGKIIEPKQAKYMRDAYMMSGITCPSDIWGENYFNKTHGDFFEDHPVLGGMWDYLLVKDNVPVKVFEMKTTKRAEDWQCDIPEYYALQASLYAYLLGIDDVVMVASFLDEWDYDNPEKYVCNNSNTITRPFKVSERYPDFESKYIAPALQWWEEHVTTGISPAFDEKRDAEILKALRTKSIPAQSGIESLIEEAELLKEEIDNHKREIEKHEQRYKQLTETIKEKAVKNFKNGDCKLQIAGKKYMWEIDKVNRQSINKTKMQENGILEDYIITEPSYRLSLKAFKED